MRLVFKKKNERKKEKCDLVDSLGRQKSRDQTDGMIGRGGQRRPRAGPPRLFRRRLTTTCRSRESLLGEEGCTRVTGWLDAMESGERA